MNLFIHFNNSPYRSIMPFKIVISYLAANKKNFLGYHSKIKIEKNAKLFIFTTEIHRYIYIGKTSREVLHIYLLIESSIYFYWIRRKHLWTTVVRELFLSWIIYSEITAAQWLDWDLNCSIYSKTDIFISQEIYWLPKLLF